MVTSSELAVQMAKELADVKHIHQWDPVEVVKFVAYRMKYFDDSFMSMVFSKCGLKDESYMALAQLRIRTDWLELRSGGSTHMPRPKREEYAAWLAQQDAEEPEPEKVQVSAILLDLESRIADPNEQKFYVETRLCLQAGAYRAAIVMAWNLGYEHLVAWIFSDTGRLRSFNDELTGRWLNKAKKRKYEPIDDREDFGSTKESIVVDVCHKATLVTKDDFEILDAALRKRNRFAHPTSDQVADSPIASGHVSELVRFMVGLD